jgi:hypothetical protein
LEFAEDFRLLGDIGWSEHDYCESYVLTIAPAALMGLLRRLRPTGS